MSGVALVLLLALELVAQTSAPGRCGSVRAGTSYSAVIVTAPQRAADTTLVATVCVVPARASTRKVGSYHGELHFDSTAVRVLSVQKAPGGVRVENATLRSQLNFAGAAPEGFNGAELVTVVLRVARDARPTLRLTMKELNATDGTSLLKGLAIVKDQ